MIEMPSFIDLHTHTRYPDKNNFPISIQSTDGYHITDFMGINNVRGIGWDDSVATDLQSCTAARELAWRSDVDRWSARHGWADWRRCGDRGRCRWQQRPTEWRSAHWAQGR